MHVAAEILRFGADPPAIDPILPPHLHISAQFPTQIVIELLFWVERVYLKGHYNESFVEKICG